MSYRIRIVIEIDVANTVSRTNVNRIAQDAMDQTVTAVSNPVFLSTQRVEKAADVLRND